MEVKEKLMTISRLAIEKVIPKKRIIIFNFYSNISNIEIKIYDYKNSIKTETKFDVWYKGEKSLKELDEVIEFLENLKGEDE